MNKNKGFTLIEMIMVITLLGIVAAIIAIPFLQGVKGWFDATTREGITQSGRIGIERMTREIRNTARTAANAPCISAATSTSFSFSDSTGNLVACNSITFSQAGAGVPYTIQRNTVDLADNIQLLTFTYYDASNTPGASAANTRRISIEIESTKGG